MPFRRYWIVGPCGSGKSTVAAAVAARLGVAPTHIDDLFWQPGWQSVNDEQLAARVAAVADRDAWVIDGNYARVRRRFFDRAEFVVWLDPPRAPTLWRLVRRCVQRAVRREPVCNGNYESLWNQFCTRDSLLLYAWRTHRSRRVLYRHELAGRPHVRLQTPHEVRAWLATL